MNEVRLSSPWSGCLGFVGRLRRVSSRGYYVPQDPDERRVTQKRFLAPGSRLSAGGKLGV